jgi:hypothetical protein
MNLFEPEAFEQIPGQLSMSDVQTPRAGQHWRDLDGYVVRIVGFSSRSGWPIVRHVNARQGGWEVNPAWFTNGWTLTKDAA